MTIQEVNELVLAKVPEEKKEAFIEEMVACKTKAEKVPVLKKYGIRLTAEEMEAINSCKLSDADLDEAAGGCCGPGCATACTTPCCFGANEL